MTRHTFNFLIDCLVAAAITAAVSLLIYMLTACSGHEPFEDHQRFLRESCLVSGGRWDNVSDECIEPTTKE